MKILGLQDGRNATTDVDSSGTTYYIDPSNGNDLNNGTTSGTALKTLNEFFLRTRTFRSFSSITVQLLGNITSATEPLGDLGGVPIYNDHYPATVIVQGQSTVLYSGTFTAVTAPNYAVNPVVVQTVTDSALSGTSWANSGPGGSSLVHKMIRIVGGVRDTATAFIYQDMGSKVARVSPFYHDPSFTIVIPQVSDAYEVVDLTKIQAGLEIRSTWATWFKDLQITNAIQARNSSILFWQCILDTAIDSCEHCPRFNFASVYLRGGITHFVGGGTFWGCLTGAGITCDPGSHISIDLTSMGTGPNCPLIVKNAGNIELMASYGVPDVTSNEVVQLRPGGTFFIRNGATIWATGATGVSTQGVWMASGTQFIWHMPNAVATNIDTKVFFNNGYGRDFLIGEVPATLTSIGTDGLVNPDNNAMVVPSRRHPGD